MLGLRQWLMVPAWNLRQYFPAPPLASPPGILRNSMVTSSISAAIYLFNNHTSSIHNGVNCKSFSHSYGFSNPGYPLVIANNHLQATQQYCTS